MFLCSQKYHTQYHVQVPMIGVRFGTLCCVNVTFDTNCIIALEKGERTARDLRRIVDSATKQRLNLRVVAISASEQPRAETEAGILEFEAKLARAGLAGVEILAPLAIWNVTYWDHCIWGSEEFSEEQRRIHEILFPTTPFGYGDYCRKHNLDPEAARAERKWLNRTIDTVLLWTHIHNGGGLLVTSDGNFHGKKEWLAPLGAGEILTPEEAALKYCPG